MAAIIEQADTRLVLELADLRLHCRIDEGDLTYDSLLKHYLAAAQQRAEDVIGGPLLTSVVREVLDGWPAIPTLRLETRGGRQLLSVELWQNGRLQAVSPDQFHSVVDQYQLCVKPLGHWPVVDRRPGAIALRYQAGLADTPEALPENVQQWLRFQVATMLANPEALADKQMVAVPLSFVDGLITRYRVNS